MRVLNLVNNSSAFCNTGYTTFVEQLFPQWLQENGITAIDTINVSELLEPLFTSTPVVLGEVEVIQSPAKVNTLLAPLVAKLDDYDYVFLHLPLLIGLELGAKLTNCKAKVIAIVHDLSPLSTHGGFWQLQAYDTKNMLSNIRNSFGDMVGCLQVCKNYKLTEFFETLYQLPPLTDEDKLGFTAYLRYYVHILKNIIVVAPSQFIVDCLQIFDVNSILLPHPTNVEVKRLQVDCTASVVSLYAWEKFDWHLYLAIVRELPDYEFSLVVAPQMRERYLENFIRGYGLPKNLTLQNYMPQIQFHDWLENSGFGMFLHLSSISESYGMVVDEMHAFGLPVILVGNDSGIVERLQLCDTFINVNTQSFLKTVHKTCDEIIRKTSIGILPKTVTQTGQAYVQTLLEL